MGCLNLPMKGPNKNGVMELSRIIKAENVRITTPNQFGEFEIPGPAEPEQYLATMYGDDWNTVAKEGYNHVAMAKSGKYETLVDFAPAQPTDPLIAHFW